MKDRGSRHEEEAEEEGRKGGGDQLQPDGFQQNKCVLSSDYTARACFSRPQPPGMKHVR